MKKTVAIISSDPISINYEILKKSLHFFKKKNKNKYIIIGSKKIFNLKIKNVEQIDINWNGKKNKSQYLKKCFEKFFFLYKTKKVHALINLPLNKKEFLKNSFPGVTEYISNKFNCLGNETMLLYSNKFSVSPITTHIEIKEISKNLTKKKIINTYNNIENFYKNIIKIDKPKIGILGFNPHNGLDFDKNLEEKKIITPAIKNLKKKGKKVYGPLSPDSSFTKRVKLKINCLIGCYHDQVLTTFKYINKFEAFNVTLGLPFLRLSPDHGTGNDIIGKNKANPESFLYCLKFLEKFYKSI